MTSSAPHGARVLRLDLDEPQALARARTAPWTPADPVLARIASWGGAATGLALLFEAAEGAGTRGAAVPLVLAAGTAVRRRLPTAARATVLSRAPLTGRLAEGQVGGALGPFLAPLADAIELRGRTELPGAVLAIGPDAVELTSRPELVGADPRTTGARLRELFGTCAVLCVGEAGERGLPFASLATGDPAPSFVGRGGLGGVLGALGLKAIVVLPGAEEEDSETTEGVRDLVAALAASPRLAARAEGGTFELLHAFAARGDLRGKNYGTPVARDDVDRLAAEVRARGVERKGCRGCPTPCGWVFERDGGAKQTAHFSAAYALGTNLGLDALDDALALLARCDRYGIDAKETGALLALACMAAERGTLPGPAAWGDVDALSAWIDAIVAGAPRARLLTGGAVAAARALGLEDELVAAGGQAARPESNLAAVLGQCVAAAGNDPMRSFPFLVEAGGRERLEALFGAPLPPGAEDPTSPVAKGRLVWWHENLVSAVDMTGFCAFSTAGLLADGLADVDRLARWLWPEAGGDGARLLAAGASLVMLRHLVEERLGSPPREAPAWARAALARPGMLGEYRAWRGLDADGRPTDAARRALGTPGLLALAPAESAEPASSGEPLPVSPAAARASGTVRLRAFGELGRGLGEGAVSEWELALPASVRTVLETVAARRAGLAERLLSPAGPIPTVWRRGRRLGPEDTVEAGDELELVVAIAGG